MALEFGHIVYPTGGRPAQIEEVEQMEKDGIAEFYMTHEIPELAVKFYLFKPVTELVREDMLLYVEDMIDHMEDVKKRLIAGGMMIEEDKA